MRRAARAICRAQTARPGRGAPACAHRWRPASAPDRPPPRDRRSPADCGTLILGPADPYVPQILFRSDQGRTIPAGGSTITYKYSLAGQPFAAEIYRRMDGSSEARIVGERFVGSG